jgi:hypothetical protein
MTTHGMSRTRVYRVWAAMLQRCTNPLSPAWPDYGGRGITVCESWRSFESFYADMGTPPPGLTIERMNNDSGYSLTNCRWATRSDQQRNRRTENVARGDRHGSVTCPGRLPRGEAHANHVLSPAAVASIRLASKGGASARNIAKGLGVSHTCVIRVLRRKTWAHV